MDIRPGDLSDPRVIDLIQTHVVEAHEGCPPDSAHALGVNELKDAAIQVWTVWEGESLLACGALKKHDNDQAEIKSMHTAKVARGKGVARLLLGHLIETCRVAGFKRVSLETGSYDQFIPARRLYEKAGFAYTPPFANYVDDPLSVFMTKEL